MQVLSVTDLTVTKGGVAYTVEAGATAQYDYGTLMGLNATADGPDQIVLDQGSAHVGGETAMVTFDSADTQAGFTLPDGTVGSLSYTIPWDQVDPSQASQALTP